MTYEEIAQQLVEQSKLAGRHEAMNDVLNWALDHKAALDRAGLTEPLITLCTRK